jgi:putative PIN family toxin of toxin-antitoxin system
VRVIVDTNVIVRGPLRSIGPPGIALRAGEGGAFTWITSPQLLAEVEQVLGRPHITRVVGEGRITRFLTAVAEVAIIVEPTHRLDVSRDADDHRVLEAAVAGNADYIVTGDRDLLELGSQAGIQIVTPAEFVKPLPR